MANDSSVKQRKKKGGWIAVEEPLVDPTAKTIVPPSQSSPTLSLTWHNLYECFSETVGNYAWRLFNEEKADLTSDQRYAILEKALGDLAVSAQNVKSLISELHKPNDLGWTLAASYGALVRIAKDWLDQNGVVVASPKVNEAQQQLLDGLNRRAKVSL